VTELLVFLGLMLLFGSPVIFAVGVLVVLWKTVF
jgi:hypothetical protein